MKLAFALTLMIAACAPNMARHTPEHGSTGPSAPPSVHATGTSSGHGFNYSKDREQPYK